MLRFHMLDSNYYTNLHQPEQVRRTKSWYGSWPRVPKSSASTPQVAKESIMGGTSKPNAMPDFSKFETKRTDDVSTETYETELDSSDISQEQQMRDSNTSQIPMQPEPTPSDTEILDVSGTEIASAEQPSNNITLRSSNGWLGWFGKTQSKQSNQEESNEPSQLEQESETITKHESIIEPITEPITELVTEPVSIPSEPIELPEEQPSENTSRNEIRTSTGNFSSWFPFWSQTVPKSSAKLPGNVITPIDNSEDLKTSDNVMIDANVAPTSPFPGSSPSSGSTWAFWSRDSKVKLIKGKGSESGELAVMGDHSEDHPKTAKAIETEYVSPSKAPLCPDTPTFKSNTPNKAKESKPKSIDLDQSFPVNSSTSFPTENSKIKTDLLRNTNISKTTMSSKTSPPNLLLPSFHSTYQTKENPSIMRQIAAFLLRTKQPPMKHVLRVTETPQLRKALSIGVHGLFPAAYLRPMIGQPTGTSIKFANHGAEAIRRWAEAKGYNDVEIEKVALEGEGKIGDRVNNLWKLLLNWLDHIRNADFIMVCCHSQGVPVSVMLVDKLIDLGIITSAKIGVCAMGTPCQHIVPYIDCFEKISLLTCSNSQLVCRLGLFQSISQAWVC